MQKCTSVQIFYMEYLRQRTWSFLHDNKTVWLNSVSNDGQYIQSDKEKYTQVFGLSSRHESSSRRSTQLSVQSGSQWKPLCKYLQSTLNPATINVICPLLWIRTVWWSVSTPRDDGGAPASRVRSKKGRSFLLLILSSWFLAMQCPQQKIQPLMNSIPRVLRCYRALRYILWTLLCRIRDLICEGLLFCANNVWNDCVVLICVQPHTWASWEIYIFVFQYCCTFIDIAV